MRAIKSFWTNNLAFVRNFSRRSVKCGIWESSLVPVRVCLHVCWGGRDRRQAGHHRKTPTGFALLLPVWLKSSHSEVRGTWEIVQRRPRKGELHPVNTFQVPTPGLSAFPLSEVTSQPDSSVAYGDSAAWLSWVHSYQLEYHLLGISLDYHLPVLCGCCRPSQELWEPLNDSFGSFHFLVHQSWIFLTLLWEDAKTLTVKSAIQSACASVDRMLGECWHVTQFLF